MVISFGHKHTNRTLPSGKVFDVRELTHSHKSPDFANKAQEIIEYGRQNPNEHICIGCEYGKHRSVVLANEVGSALRTSVYHRDSTSTR